MSSGVRVLLYIVSFLVPVVGIILGIVFMVRADPEYKRVGKICLILGVVAIVVEIGLAVALYVMVLGFSHSSTSTPTTTLSEESIVGGMKFTIRSFNVEVAWTDVSILVDTLEAAVSWAPSSSDLTGGIGTTAVYGPETFGALSVTLTVTDLSGNGRVDMGDYFTLTTSPDFSVSEEYSLAMIYEPTDGVIAQSTFSG